MLQKLGTQGTKGTGMIPNWMRSMFGTVKTAPAAKGKRAGRPLRFRPAVLLLEEREVPATYVVAGTTEADLTAAINSALADANTVNTISFQAPTVPAGTVFNLASDPGPVRFTRSTNLSFLTHRPA
jgi:hypothetical protein